jgi:primosomal protein N' (replication factor Y)
MISKGMDFKNVTLVGVVAADTTLNLPDFKAAERTFQLLTQVSGRAGRGEIEGRVVVQTYNPDHYSITLASKHDYINFYKKEIELRRILKNPPFSDILYIILTSENEEQLINTCMKIGMEIQNIIDKKMVEMLGPAPCSISKIKSSYRWHIILKGNAYPYYKKMDDIIHSMLNGNKVNYSIDMNPYTIV